MNIVDIAYSRGNSRKISVIYNSNKGNFVEEKEFELPFLLVKSTISKSDLEQIRYEYRGESKTPESVKAIEKVLRGETVDMFKVCTLLPIEIPVLKRKLLDQGLEVFEVVKDSAAEKAGLRKGDFISKVDGEPIETREELTIAIATNNPGKQVVIEYRRGEKEMSSKIKLGHRPGKKEEAEEEEE